MDELDSWRNRHLTLKLELLNLSKKIEGANPEDIRFYQEICEKYAYHLKQLETDCFQRLGVRICSCGFNPENC